MKIRELSENSINIYVNLVIGTESFSKWIFGIKYSKGRLHLLYILQYH